MPDVAVTPAERAANAVTPTHGDPAPGARRPRLQAVRTAGDLAGLGPDRGAEWQALAEAAGHVAVFQSPGFVLTWYEVYADAYDPLLLLGCDADNRLVGVLPLAVSRGAGRRLTFAGAEHCEYAGWLASPGFEEEFPALCLVHLHARGDLSAPWDWRWLAPGLGLGWLDHPGLAARGIVGRIRTGTTPVLDLTDPGRPRFFAPGKKNFKRKMNLLRALGEVRLARVEAAGPGGLLERLATLYDIRQTARFGSAPFADDPRKVVFHQRLLERAPEAVRCFALVAGAHAVAYSWTMVSGGRAIHSMAPFDPRWLAASPGKLVVDLVADELARQALTRYDHSPGGDEYKEEAVSGHEDVQQLVVFPSRIRARLSDARETLRGWAKRLALAAGVGPRHVGRLRALRSRARGRSVGSLVRAALRAGRGWVWSRAVVIVYRFDRAAWQAAYPHAAPDPGFRKDALEDFLRYAESMPWLSRQQMMQAAIARLEDGQHCYTVVEDGVLVHFAWLQPDAQEVRLTEVDYPLAIPRGTAMAYGVFTEPRARGRGLHQRSFQHRLLEAFTLGADSVLTAIEEGNRPSAHNAEKIGFRPVARIARIRRFGRDTWTEAGLAAPVPGEGPA